MQTADLVVANNGSDIQSVDDLHRFLSEWPIGRAVEIDIVRGHSRQALMVIPKEADE
jgi:S1-C subfamily serine protease